MLINTYLHPTIFMFFFNSFVPTKLNPIFHLFRIFIILHLLNKLKPYLLKEYTIFQHIPLNKLLTSFHVF